MILHVPPDGRTSGDDISADLPLLAALRGRVSACLLRLAHDYSTHTDFAGNAVLDDDTRDFVFADILLAEKEAGR